MLSEQVSQLTAVSEAAVVSNLRTNRNGIQEMLRIEIASSNACVTLICFGRLTLGVELETLRSIAQSRHEEQIRIDLSAVDRIDASGLGLLLELQAWANQHRRTLILIDLSDNVWRMVVLTKLYGALEISSSDSAALPCDGNNLEPDEMIA